MMAVVENLSWQQYVNSMIWIIFDIWWGWESMMVGDHWATCYAQDI
jgi:hypothetical protein